MVSKKDDRKAVQIRNILDNLPDESLATSDPRLRDVLSAFVTPDGKALSVAGKRVPFVDPQQAEAAGALVCIEITIPLLWADNATGPCGACGKTLQWAANAPKAPMRMCLSCVEMMALCRNLQ